MQVQQGRRVSVPKTQAAGAYPLALVQLWAQTFVGSIGVAGRDSELLDLQWISELKSHGVAKQVSCEQTPGPAPKLTHVEAIGEAQKFVTYGQHSSAKASQNQAKLHRFGKLNAVLPESPGSTDSPGPPQTSATSGAPRSRPYTAEI